MAIITDIANSNPMNLLHMAVMKSADGLPERPVPREFDFCFCDFECEFEYLVFASPGNEDWKNDFNAFPVQLLDPADTVIFRLLDENDQEIAVISDDTYGTYFPAGTFTDDPLFTGFKVEWEKVFSVEGAGLYKIQIETSILGLVQTTTSFDFRLLPFSDTLADGTVRIDTIQNGYIESSPFDFTGKEWENSIRIEGRIFNRRPQLETDRYANSNRELVQIQDRITNLYTLESKLLPSEIANTIIYNFLLANRIFVTDYNLFNHVRFTEKELAVESIEDPQEFFATTKAVYNIELTDKKQDIIKRNFR